MNKDISRLIRRSNNIAILIHDKPDGDAIASALALYEALGPNKDKLLFCADPLLAPFDKLPNADQFRQIDDLRRAEELKSDIVMIDLIFAFDSANLDQLSSLKYIKKFTSPSTDIINVDHHRGNTEFGTINIVKPDSSSTAEILATELEIWGLKITKSVAHLLLAGLVADTQAFRTFNVTAHTLSIASKLIDAGANLYYIVEKLYSGYPIYTIKTWAEVLKDLKIDEDNRIALAAIPHSLILQSMRGEQDFKGLPNFIQRSRDVKVAIVLVEREPGFIKVSLRSKPGFDCVSVVERFSGGGHYAAAGCLLPDNNLQSAERIILEAVYSELGANKCPLLSDVE